MSQQINLFDAALLRQRELLTITNLAALALALLVAVGGWGALARSQLAAADAEAKSLAPQVKALQDQIVAVGKQLADIKPDARLEAELASARALLVLRSDIVAALKKGLGEDSASFAEYLRGFARQTVSGLWLTGFVIGEGGAMEIRGRMTDPALLPEYIRRLNSEKAFQGRAFAALKVSAGKAVADAPAAGQTPAAAPASAAAPYHEFVLTPVPGPADAGPGAQEGKR